MWAGRNTLIRTVALGLLIPLWTGCPVDRIHGIVANTDNERLPGVAVGVETEHGIEAQTLTNSLGEYSVSSAAGKVRVSFLKNGYTSGHLELNLDAGSNRQVPDMVLWPLPPEAGIFLCEGTQYRRMTPVEARPLVAQASNAVIFGLTFSMAPEKTSAAEPYLLLHKLPGYDVQMAKLCAVQAYSVGNSGPVQEVWIAERTLPCSLDPVDEPERYLQQIRLAAPLEPGFYAIHWGALSGHKTAEPRAFVVQIESPASGQAEPAPAQQQAPPARAENKERGATKPAPEAKEPEAKTSAQKTTAAGPTGH